MSSKRLDKISEYARHGYAMTVQCRSCGHSAKLDARAISDETVRRNLSRDIGAIERRLSAPRRGAAQHFVAFNAMDYIDLMFRRPAKLEIEAFDIGAAMVLVLACWIFRIGSG